MRYGDGDGDGDPVGMSIAYILGHLSISSYVYAHWQTLEKRCQPIPQRVVVVS